MASTEGAPIPRVYGRARLAGQVIWATKIEGGHIAAQRDRRRRQGLAAGDDQHDGLQLLRELRGGLCEGPIGRVGRFWADGKPLDLVGLNYRIYPAARRRRPTR
jgi:hypothetical protein